MLCCACCITQSCLTLCAPIYCNVLGSSVLGYSPGKNTGVGSHALLQGIFPTQGSKPGLPHCRWILYSLRHQVSRRVLKWVAFLFSRGSSQPRDQSQVSHIVSGLFTSWATKEAQEYWRGKPIPSAVDLPNPGIELGPALHADSLPTELSGSPYSIQLLSFSDINIFCLK